MASSASAAVGTDSEPEFHYRFGIRLFIDGVKAAALRISGEATADTRSG